MSEFVGKALEISKKNYTFGYLKLKQRFKKVILEVSKLEKGRRRIED